MTKREELLQAIEGLSEEAIVRVIAVAREVGAAEGTCSTALASDTQAWLKASTTDTLAALEAQEADLPEAERAAWLEAMWDNATPVRFDEATGDCSTFSGRADYFVRPISASGAGVDDV